MRSPNSERRHDGAAGFSRGRRHCLAGGGRQLIQERTGNIAGEGGLISFPESRWLASIVVPHQPHFIGQPADVGVFWGYALNVDSCGDFVDKPITACSGREILTEVLGHLGGHPRDWEDPERGNVYSLHDALYHESVSAPQPG